MNGETPNRKPLVRKVEESEIEEVMVETPEPVVVKAPEPITPKIYTCQTRCWAKKQLWEVGETTTFTPGEFIPEHFK